MLKKKSFRSAILHFGPGKTGTTSIQSACNIHRELLKEYNIYYPHGIWHCELASCFSDAPESETLNVIFGHTDKEYLKKRDNEYLDSLYKELENKNFKYLVLSCEAFDFINENAIEKIKTFVLQFAEECKVIYYVRNPVSYATSAMSQNSKMGVLSENKNIVPTSNYINRIKAISAVVGIENIILRVFDRNALVGNDVIIDFLSILDCPINIASDIAIRMKQYNNDNVSLSMEATLIGAEIGKVLSTTNISQMDFAKIFEPILVKIKGNKIQLTKKQLENLIRITRSDMQYLKDKFNINFNYFSTNDYIDSNNYLSVETAESIAQLIIELAAPELAKGQNKEVISSEFQLRQAILKEGYDIVHGQNLCFEVEFSLDREIAELEAGIHIWDSHERWAFGVNSTLQKQVMRDVSPGIYQISHYVIADLPEGVYTAGFSFTEKLLGGSDYELMWYDKLCEFRVFYPVDRIGIGYANLPSVQMLTKIRDIQKITNGAGRMVPVSIPSKMKPSETLTIDVEVYNDTDVIWRGDPFRPINLSYYWLDEHDTIVVFEGVRTPVPDNGVLGYDSALVSLRIVAPKEEGKYKLIVTMVQEGVNWFENIGFKPYNVMIEIKN